MTGQDDKVKKALPPIPAKHYFTISEVSELCGVKKHVLRYWEQEFTQLKPVRRRNRRYYQRHEVLLIRRIRELLWEQGYTTDGARNWLEGRSSQDVRQETDEAALPLAEQEASEKELAAVRQELELILSLLDMPKE